MDLVEVAPMANPPVCRIMDYGKFKFDAAQKAREARRKAQNVSIKEMKYRVKIGPGDFDTKTRKVAHFLAEGHKVKLTIMFRGREMDRPQFGKAILDKVASQVAEVGKVEYEPRVDGRNMIMVLAPDKKAQAAHAAAAAKEGAESTESTSTTSTTTSEASQPANATNDNHSNAASGANPASSTKPVEK
jgi:translation initiation factor IF-3